MFWDVSGLTCFVAGEEEEDEGEEKKELLLQGCCSSSVKCRANLKKKTLFELFAENVFS